MVALLIALSIQSAECSVACRYLGYDGGYFDKDACVCFDRKDYEEIVHVKRTISPKKPHTPKKTITEEF